MDRLESVLLLHGEIVVLHLMDMIICWVIYPQTQTGMDLG